MIPNEGAEYTRTTTNWFVPATYREVDAASLEWVRRAARQGLWQALWFLPSMYKKTDIVQAYAWNLAFLHRTDSDDKVNHSGVETTRSALLRKKMTDH